MSTSDKITNVVFYHANCADGKAAAAVCLRAMKYTAHYEHMNYSENQPDVFKDLVEEGKFKLEDIEYIYYVDFSPSNDMLEFMKNYPSIKIVVIDHHKNTEVDNMAEKVHDYYFSLEKSGCVLAFEYFFPGEEIPYLLQILQDRDLWKFELPETKPFTAYHRTAKSSLTELLCLFHQKKDGDVITKYTESGRIILEMDKKVSEDQASKAIIIDFMGYKVALSNVCGLISATGEVLYKTLDIDFSMTYFVTNEGEVVFSLRSNSFDVGALAKSLGGGGHKYAAGFTKDLTFLSEIYKGISQK